MNEVSLENLQEEEQHIKDFVLEENRKLQIQLHAIQRKLDEMSKS